MAFTVEQVAKIRELRHRYEVSGMSSHGRAAYTFYATRRDGALIQVNYGMGEFLDKICDINTKWHPSHVEFEVANKNEYSVECSNTWVMKLCNDIQKALNDREKNNYYPDFS